MAFLNGSDDRSDFLRPAPGSNGGATRSCASTGRGPTLRRPGPRYYGRHQSRRVGRRRRAGRTGALPLRARRPRLPKLLAARRDGRPRRLAAAVHAGLRGLHNAGERVRGRRRRPGGRHGPRRHRAAPSRAALPETAPGTAACSGRIRRGERRLQREPRLHAGPLATSRALEVPGARIAVLGDMGEPAPGGRSFAEGVGGGAAAMPLDALVCVGELSEGDADGAERAGMDPEKIVRAHSVAEVAESWRSRSQGCRAREGVALHGLTRGRRIGQLTCLQYFPHTRRFWCFLPWCWPSSSPWRSCPCGYVSCAQPHRPAGARPTGPKAIW